MVLVRLHVYSVQRGGALAASHSVPGLAHSNSRATESLLDRQLVEMIKHSTLRLLVQRSLRILFSSQYLLIRHG